MSKKQVKKCQNVNTLGEIRRLIWGVLYRMASEFTAEAASRPQREMCGWQLMSPDAGWRADGKRTLSSVSWWPRLCNYLCAFHLQREICRWQLMSPDELMENGWVPVDGFVSQSLNLSFYGIIFTSPILPAFNASSPSFQLPLPSHSYFHYIRQSK